MNILHVISSVNPAHGGPIEGIKQLSSVAQIQGHSVEVTCLDSPHAPFVASFPFPVHALGPGYGKFQFSRRLVPWLSQNASKYDVVVVNGIWQYHSFGAWRALSRSSTPYVVFTHGMLDPWFKRTYPLKHAKKWLYWPWGEYRVLRDAAAVLFTCEEERILAKRSFWLYRANEAVINYGTAGPSNAQPGETSPIWDLFPKLRGKRLALFMGRIHPKKGCDLAIRAFADRLGSDSTWQLVMAGPDQVGWKAKLIELAEQLKISERITWTGQVAGDLKWGLMRAAEVLFLPSHQENFGIVVAEALACGLPVLISDKVNIWREVSEDGGGLVADDSLHGAMSLLDRWIELPACRKAEMRECARRSFEERFEIRKASESIFKVLGSVIDKRSRYATA